MITDLAELVRRLETRADGWVWLTLDRAKERFNDCTCGLDDLKARIKEAL